MLLTKFDPMKDFRDLEKRMESAFKFPEIGELSNVSGFSPSVDLKDDVLTISGERKTKKEIKEKDYYKMESSYGKFQRSFTLPENTDAENIEANSKDGVLEVVIPKMKRSKKETKKIKIK